MALRTRENGQVWMHKVTFLARVKRDSVADQTFWLCFESSFWAVPQVSLGNMGTLVETVKIFFIVLQVAFWGLVIVSRPTYRPVLYFIVGTVSLLLLFKSSASDLIFRQNRSLNLSR